MKMEIKFYDCNQENLEREYSDYVKKVTDNKDCTICTNVIVMVKYSRPKCGDREYIETEYKLMTTPVVIKWDNGQCFVHKTPFISFWFKNVMMDNVIKFAKMEDINWSEI